MTTETVTQHTPGPWAVVEASADDYEQGGAQVEDPDGLVIASIWTFSAPDRGGQAGANARLIAAAPDLLEALETFMAIDDPGEWKDAIPQMRAAIAKARGG